MNDTKLAPFAGQKYLSLESYRKSGQAVQTPLWFVEENGVLYVYSLADAWKVKRVRNNPRVRIAPCDFRGQLKGDWLEAQANILNPAEAEHGQTLFRQKYGWMKRIGEIVGKFKKREHTVIAIRPV
jgi:uncharacterized protein